MNRLLSFSLPDHCGQLPAAGWGEAVLVVSSLAFVAVAIWAWLAWQRQGGQDFTVLMLIVLTGVSGPTLALWHLFPGPLTVAPAALTLFCVFFGAIFVVLRQQFALSVLASSGALVALGGLTLAAKAFGPPQAFGGGMPWLPVLIALYLVGAALVFEARLALHRDMSLTGRAAAASDARHFPRLKTGYAMIYAGLVLALALTARALEARLCASLPMSLHVIWHLFAAAAAMILLGAAIRHAPEGP